MLKHGVIVVGYGGSRRGRRRRHWSGLRRRRFCFRWLVGLGLGRACSRTAQHWRRIRVFIGRLRCRHDLLFRFRAGGFPTSRAPPGIFGLQRAGDGEQSERGASAFGFIDDSGIERHGDGVGLVGRGIVELAIVENADGKQAALAVGSEFKQAEGARSLAGFARDGALGILGAGNLRGQQSHARERDEPQRRAV